MANTVSKAGKKKLEADLDYLITVRRGEVAQKLKEASKESVLTPEKIQHIMAAKPPSVKPRDPQLMIPVAKVERYFPKGFTSDQMQQVIVKLLENYARAHQHGSR